MRHSLLIGVLGGLLLVAQTPLCSAAVASREALDILHRTRAIGCDGQAGIKQGLKLQRELTTAARGMRDGGSLKAALAKAGYRADASAVMRLGGDIDAKTVRAALTSRYCTLIMDRSYTEVGIYADAHALVYVLAAPFAPPAARDSGRVAQDVLTLVNRARSQSRRCGRESFRATTALKLNSELNAAAKGHAHDMAVHDKLAHEGSDGSDPGQRAARAGYRWKTIGENVAAGQLTAQEVVAGWLTSPPHCSNMMDPRFVEMGIAFAVDERSSEGIYWAQEFGTPRP